MDAFMGEDGDSVKAMSGELMIHMKHPIWANWVNWVNFVCRTAIFHVQWGLMEEKVATARLDPSHRQSIVAAQKPKGKPLVGRVLNPHLMISRSPKYKIR